MKKLLSLTLGLVLTLSLAACGGSGATPAPSEAPSVSPAADSDLEYLKGKGEMIIGYTVYEPMNYTDENGEFVGFDTELARVVCEKLGVTPSFQEIVWETKEVELNARTIDCIWNGLTIDEERQKTMAITDPYVINAQVVVMRSGNGYEGTTSLIGKTVCAEQGSAGQNYIQTMDTLSQATYIPKTLQTECLLEVKAGTCDAAVLDLTLAKAMIGEGTDYADLQIVDYLGEEYYGVAFRKGSDARDALNAIFEELKADGTLAALADKYNLELAD